MDTFNIIVAIAGMAGAIIAGAITAAWVLHNRSSVKETDAAVLAVTLKNSIDNLTKELSTAKSGFDGSIRDLRVSITEVRKAFEGSNIAVLRVKMAYMANEINSLRRFRHAVCNALNPIFHEKKIVVDYDEPGLKDVDFEGIALKAVGTPGV